MRGGKRMGLAYFKCILTGERVEFQDCLKCSREGRKCDFPYPIIKAIIPEDYENDPKRIGVTGILGCMRKAILSKTTEYGESPESLFYLWRGKLTHKILETYSEDQNEKEMYLAEYKVEVPIGDYLLVGKIDEYDKKLGIVVDYKTVKKVPQYRYCYGDHERQLNIYKWMLEQKGFIVNRLEIVYIDGSGVRRMEARIRTGQEKFVKEKIGIIKEALENKLIPSKQIENRWACDYCPEEIYYKCQEIAQVETGEPIVSKKRRRMIEEK